jgi:hypothetical protein
VALARQGRRAVFVDADLDHGGNNQLSQYSDRGSVIDVLAGAGAVGHSGALRRLGLGRVDRLSGGAAGAVYRGA